MERAIWISWRVFWVGLGASLVLVGQAIVSSPEEAPKPAEPAITVPAPAKPAQPILSHVGVKRGPLG